MKGSCKICGCSKENPCTTPEGPCRWVLDDLCSACIIHLKPGEHTYKDGKYGLLIEKMCLFCAHRVPDEEGANCGYPNHWTCDKGRLDDRMPDGSYIHVSYALSGFKRRNKGIQRAQAHCPDWQVHSRYLKGANK